MNGKKTWFSYIIWGMFALPAIAYAVFAGRNACFVFFPVLKAGYLPWLVAAIVVVMMALLYLLGNLIVTRLKIYFEINLRTRTAWECVIALLLFAGAAFYKAYYVFYQYQGMTGDNSYYLRAMIQSESVKPEVAHGSAHIYIAALSSLFSFLGNKEVMVFYFQLFLQLVTFILLYFSIRNLCSKLAALVMSGILIFSSTFMEMTIVIEPGVFYFFLWSIGLFCISIFFKTAYNRGWYHNNSGEILLFLLCMYIGILSFWDVLGLLLVPVMGNALFQVNKSPVMQQLFEELHRLDDAEQERKRQEREHKKEAKKIKRSGIYFAEEASIEIEDTKTVMEYSTQAVIVFCGVAFGLFCTILKYTGMTGLLFRDQCLEWLRNYPIQISFSWSLPQDQVFVILAIGTGIVFFLPGFIRCREQSATVWMVLVMLISVILPILNLKFVDQSMFVLFLWAVVAGQGIQLFYQNIWNHEEMLIDIEETGTVAMKPNEIIKSKEKELQKENPWEDLEPGKAEPIQAQDELLKQQTPVHFIENPLPTPKKHIKKTMDYTYAIEADKLEFDQEIRKDDDFDY